MNSIENDIVKRTMSIAMSKAITTIMFVCSTILISSFTYTIICISYLSITGWLLRLEQRLLSTIQDLYIRYWTRGYFYHTGFNHIDVHQ